MAIDIFECKGKQPLEKPFPTVSVTFRLIRLRITVSLIRGTKTAQKEASEAAGQRLVEPLTCHCPHCLTYGLGSRKSAAQEAPYGSPR